VNLQRFSEFPNVHITCFTIKVVNRLSRYIKDISAQKRPLLNLNGQVQLELPQPHFTSTYMVGDLSVMGIPLTLGYLGKYLNMFDHPEEEHVVT
jgi:hypothetical protein